jgi:hypothetical protein
MEETIMICRKASLALTVMLLGFSTPAFADKAMLVFDASGSMWGQIGGKSKIQIAREVVGGLIDGWPEQTELGLMAYGHREKDNCGDIQTLVSPAPKSWAAIKAAIGDIDPKGKTPITEAVRAAARALRSEEGKATVILISDGLETCHADPCAAASELEKAGVDFTVHVVGFGTNKDENRQLQCLADNTGGRFLGASNASELKAAMSKTVELVAKPEPPSKSVEVKTRLATVQVGWLRLDNSASGADVYDGDGRQVGRVCTGCGERQLAPGTYRIKADGIDVETVVKAGDRKVIDAATMAGWLLLDTSVKSGVDIYLEGQKFARACVGCGKKQLPPGKYQVRGDGFETEIEIEIGRESILKVEK